MKDVFFALWFFLPAGIANVTPIFAAHIQFLKQWNYPLDFFLKVNNKRIFGDHKTFRGFVSGIILGTLTCVLLLKLSNTLPYALRTMPSWYFQTNPVVLGFLLSFGALFGDAMKSFLKRQVDIKSGSTWIPFDQIDYIVGGLFFSSFIHVLTSIQYIVIFILWVGIHMISTYTGYFLRLKNQPL